MSQSNDATPAYRGYRLQSLYVLFRLLCQEWNDNLVFHLEVLEDLSIQNEKSDVLEVIQVKSGEGLALSSFKKSFFQRINSLIKTQNPPQIIIASFGEVGPELRKAIEQDGPNREKVAEKIKEKCKDFIHSDEEAKIIIENLKLTYPDEQELTEKVYGYLRDTLTGIDPVSSFDLLNFWIYICSEKKCSITKNDIVKKILDVGKFLADRASYHEEWFRSIKPIEDKQIDTNGLGKLHEEFYQGISARYDHILANTDVSRFRKIEEIKAKFEESQVVIIHGASGQGKTTLAYRYLHDHFPNTWRFKVELIEDRRHALNIARALMGHVDAINIPIAVYIDVSAKDSNWPELIRQLSIHQNIQVIVTVREEDYNRVSIEDFEIQFKDIDLTFDESEAQEIYQSLKKARIPTRFLGFEEAWDKFKGEGPLMEFIYLVTQGESLQKRLKEQVTRLRDEARQRKIEPGEIELLTLVSVASAFDARLKVKLLIDSLELASPQRTFELFDKEYLLRLSDDGSLVKGLHPIRSEILANLLTDNTISPWSKYATSILPMVHEIDIESFLLYAFSRRRSDTEFLLLALNSWQPDKWTAIGGITRALIWLGIREYVETNRELIGETIEDSKTGFTLLLDFDISNSMPGIATSTLNSFYREGLIDEIRYQQILSYRTRQTDKSYVSVRAKEWLSSRTICPATPQHNEDWYGMAEVSFWLGHFGIFWPFFERRFDLELEKAIECLPLEILSDLILGLNNGFKIYFATWISSNRSKLINRFREETLTINLQDENSKVSIHFIIEFEKLNSSKFGSNVVVEPSNYLHDEAMRRIRLLRGILPDREIYACQGYGHKVWNEKLPLDETQKTGISISQLPPKWLTSVNSTFRGLAEQSYRPNNWEEYANSILELRKKTLSAAEYLDSGLKTYFEKKNPEQLFGKLINIEQLSEYQKILSKSPLIPSCAVDEWGFVDEFHIAQIDSFENSQDKRDIIRVLALQNHSSFLTYFKEYIRHLENFLKQSVHTMMINSIRGKCIENESLKLKFEQEAIKAGFKPHLITLSRVNLSDFIKILPTFQRVFRQKFEPFYEESAINDLEKQELSTFRNLWCLWYFFSTNPNLTYRNPERKCVNYTDQMINVIKNNVRKNISKISSEDLLISVVSEDTFWEDQPSLWISVDGKKGTEVYSSVEKIFSEIFKSVNSFRNQEFAKLIFRVKWPLIIVVPKIQGKCLTDKAWRIYSNTLMGSNNGYLNWWNFAIQYPIPKDALTELNINVWDIPQLEVATKFIQNIIKLSQQLTSIKDLERLPELDNQGISQLEVYAIKLMKDVKLVTRIILVSAEEMKNDLEKLPSSDYHTPPDVSESIKALNEVIRDMLSLSSSQEIIDLELKSILKWVNKLDKWKNCEIFAKMAYLLWVSDVINSKKKGSVEIL